MEWVVGIVGRVGQPKKASHISRNAICSQVICLAPTESSKFFHSSQTKNHQEPPPVSLSRLRCHRNSDIRDHLEKTLLPTPTSRSPPRGQSAGRDLKSMKGEEKKGGRKGSRAGESYSGREGQIRREGEGGKERRREGERRRGREKERRRQKKKKERIRERETMRERGRETTKLQKARRNIGVCAGVLI